MKKHFMFISLLSFFICIIAPLSLISCKTTDQETKPSSRKESSGDYVLNLYDNCPRTTSGLKALMWIKLSVEDYQGLTEVKIHSSPSGKDVKNLSDYILYCSMIARTISSESQKDCGIIFNTQKDQSGIFLDLSTAESALESLKILTQQDQHDIYAFYIY